MSTQLIGFSMGGICRRFLVTPPSMIWPANLVNCALFNTLHSKHYSGIGERGGVSRERFFMYVFVGGACYYILPGYVFSSSSFPLKVRGSNQTCSRRYLFSALSYFTWVTWIAPNNATVNTLFGYSSGLGMSLITFDWSQITYIGSPLAVPWWAEANIIGGMGTSILCIYCSIIFLTSSSSTVFFYWVITPALYFTNTWYGKYMPILANYAFDNTGATYNVTAILSAEKTFDRAKYEAYSPLFLPTAFAISYGLSFASVTATITHAFLYFRKQIWQQSRRSLSEQPDIHARLMSKYREVPDWWYGCVFVSMFVFAIIAIEVWPTEFPVWGLIVALLISFVYIVPIGMIQAITKYVSSMRLSRVAFVHFNETYISNLFNLTANKSDSTSSLNSSLVTPFLVVRSQ